MDKHILDVTCSNRSIWFDKECKAAIYCDKRTEHYTGTFGKDNMNLTLDISPDIECDFTDLPFEDESFELVVMDPPHAVNLKDSSWIKKHYGSLETGWEQMIHDGVRECMRVLKPYGTLIFKWSDVTISTRQIIDAIGFDPLFGHRSGKKMNTHWMTFMKGVSETGR